MQQYDKLIREFRKSRIDKSLIVNNYIGIILKEYIYRDALTMDGIPEFNFEDEIPDTFRRDYPHVYDIINLRYNVRAEMLNAAMTHNMDLKYLNTLADILMRKR